MLSKIIKSKTLFFFITTAVILSLNLAPLVVLYRHSPPGRSFALVHNNVQDFNFYQALMNEGANGAFSTTDPYTLEPHAPSILFSYFVWFGKLSTILSIPHALTYHSIRILSAVLFLFLVYYFLFFLKIPYPRLTYLFFLFAAPLLHTTSEGQVEYMNWWTAMDPIRRSAYLPHHMIGGFLLVISFIFLLNLFQGDIKSFYRSFIILPILAFFHPPSLLIIIISLPPALITYRFILKQKLNNKILLGFILFWLIGLSSLLLMVFFTNRGEIWTSAYNWEKRQQMNILGELPGALGILLPFALLGILKSFKSKEFKYILVSSWLVSPLILIPIAPLLGIANVRLIQGLPYLPLAILSVLGIKMLINLINLKINKFIGLLGYWIIGLLFIIFTIPTLQWSLKDQIREYWPIFGNVYLDNRLFASFDFINRNYPRKVVILSGFYTGNYLPVYTNSINYLGHFGYTYNAGKKQELSGKFFGDKMTAEEAKEFIQSNKIDLIFQGPEEKPIYNHYLYPNIIKPVYDKEEATIYTPNF